MAPPTGPHPIPARSPPLLLSCLPPALPAPRGAESWLYKRQSQGLRTPELATNNYHWRYEIEGCCFLPDQLSTVEPWPLAKKRHLHLCFISRLGSRRPVNGSVAFQDLLLLLFMVGAQAKVQRKFYRFWGWPLPTILTSQGPSVLVRAPSPRSLTPGAERNCP